MVQISTAQPEVGEVLLVEPGGFLNGGGGKGGEEGCGGREGGREEGRGGNKCKKKLCWSELLQISPAFPLPPSRPPSLSSCLHLLSPGSYRTLLKPNTTIAKPCELNPPSLPPSLPPPPASTARHRFSTASIHLSPA